MKSTVEPAETEELEYPILMEWISSAPYDEDALLVVSFHNSTCGTVVAVKNVPSRFVGNCSATFRPANDKTCWKKFTGKVILEN